MGEEKPDEELMGKRKSSPRLSTASCDADDFILSGFGKIIHSTFEKIGSCLFTKQLCGTIGEIAAKGVIEVRVISGVAKGRPLKAVPGNGTRPTTDKVKEAIFSMIGPYFDGGTALDLFAGTGGLGIEAWSRGVERVIFVDREKISIDVIRHNLAAAGAEQASEIYRNDAERALKALAKRGIKFELVFLDPPYKMATMDAVMEELAAKEMLAPDATIVVEHDAEVVYPEELASFRQIRQAKYGDIAVSIYEYIQGNDTEDGGDRSDDEQ
jgi:16S rRNA (guanine(966)-N(2))-methyltransferase RsmD